MINLPVLERLDVTGYGLFPGREGREHGLHVEFQPGLTLILGTNGLGKSTLVGIIYRLLTGPFDIPGLDTRSNLGGIRLNTAEVPARVRGAFAQRVVDGARGAKARLAFKLGGQELIVERDLNNLSLTRFSINGNLQATGEQEAFQSEIARLVGVWSFGDWVLLLRYLMFYFEDRSALVWDPSAQVQILRSLFLPAETARKWTEDARVILQLDSRMRNLGAALTQEERSLAATEYNIAVGLDVRQELQTLEQLQGIDQERRERLEEQVVDVEASRQEARLRFMRAEQEREGRFRKLERAKLTAIAARFPERSETARYILAMLMTEETCLVCEHIAPVAAAEYASRIEHRRCVACGTDLSDDETSIPPADLADKRVQRAEDELRPIETDLGEAKRVLEEADRNHNAHYNEIQELNYKIAERSRKIDSLVRRLPPEEAELHKQRSDLASLRSRVEELRSDLALKRQAFRNFVEEVSRELVTQSEAIKQAFDGFAEGFLLESCSLVWAPQKATVGEAGVQIAFPAFELEMTGTDFPLPVRRNGPEQVSESQREFIDLAFRMALMQIAGSQGVGSLVIDAPESSLDAVFVARAANVLIRFAEPARGNRLVITSNLIEGGLIPSLIGSVGRPDDREGRLVDLFTIAVPTAAVRRLRSEYDRVRDTLLGHNFGSTM